MALTNHERVGKALDLLNKGLRPFVEREMKLSLGELWQQAVKNSLMNEAAAKADKTGQLHLDTQALLSIMWNQWEAAFKRTLGRAERTLVSELRDVRNKWAHQEPFSTDDVYRALDSVKRLLEAVSSPEAAAVEKQKQEVLRVRFDEQARQETRRVSSAPLAGTPARGLLPWREIITPHPDVASGRYQQAEFAADLWQVYQYEGSDEYKKPHDFFQRTHITDGLRRLLVGALRRLNDKGGDPIVELQTNFGGGKTHTLLSLYHLCSDVAPTDLPGLEPVFAEADVPKPKSVRRVVIVGSQIPPGQPLKKPDGVTVRTLWGEIAWQLGGKEAYQAIREADETGTNPGSELAKLFKKYAPCLILIDEWVAYARQLHDEQPPLPGGTFSAQFTFAQALTEAVKSAPKTMLVVSIPVSDNEMGGDRGRLATDRLRNVIGRTESPWRPASAEESFEIVRKRLFQPITAPEKFAARDAVAKAFVEMYREDAQDYPKECGERAYEQRIVSAYPIHPELFDRLYTDWSSLDRFQRTRGVLRLMAAVIHTLWERQDPNLLILPASVPIDNPDALTELTRYLEDPWVPVIEKDVDGSHSLALKLDRENPNLGRYSACRRVARTIYLGSAPTLHTAHRGLEDLNIKLGCVQPGESVATFGDALRRLADQATHLYGEGRRYWYSTQPSVTRLAQDRAAQKHLDEVHEEIKRRLREEQGRRGDLHCVHAAPVSSGDVPDEAEARLVILDPEHPHSSKEKDSSARKYAEEIQSNRGTSPRNYKNALVYLAADKTRLDELVQAVRLHLAWESIAQEREKQNLDAFQSKQVDKMCGDTDKTVTQRIQETFQWLLVPGQSNPSGAIEWQEMRLQGQDPLAVRASKKMKDGELMMTRCAGTRLRLELDRIPLWRGDHVPLKQLAEDFAKYLYLPRLKGPEVLVEAVEDGMALLSWQQESFAYADGWDEVQKRYRGLKAGQRGRASLEGGGLLVKPDVAARQLAVKAEIGVPGTPKGANSSPAGPGVPEAKPSPDGSAPIPVPAAPPSPRRFHGSVSLDPARLGRDAGRIAEEVVQHIAGLVGAQVEIHLEIRAEIPQGVPENVVRTVSENCRTLKFKTHGFEES